MVATILLLLVVAVAAMRVSAYGQPYPYPYSADCDMEIHLGLNDSFVIHSFPPNQIQTSYFPRECTLHFKARDGCVLKLTTSYYKRGDIDCEEQYLLVGDENKKKRFCGFGRPPRSFKSTGRELFLTHFQRNGQHTKGFTLASTIDGAVHCEKGTPLPICSAPSTLNCTTSKDYVNSNPGASLVINTSDDGTHELPTNVSSTCHVKGLDACIAKAIICNSIHCDGTLPKPMDPLPAGCNPQTIPCETVGGCQWVDTPKLDGVVADKPFTTGCSLGAGQLCEHSVVACTTQSS